MNRHGEQACYDLYMHTAFRRNLFILLLVDEYMKSIIQRLISTSGYTENVHKWAPLFNHEGETVK